MRLQIGSLYPSYELRQPAKHRFVAACALYQATGDITYYNQAKNYQEIAKDRQYWPVLNFDNPYWLGLLCIARSAPTAKERTDARDTLYKQLLQDWFESKTYKGTGKKPLIKCAPAPPALGLCSVLETLGCCATMHVQVPPGKPSE